MEILALGAPAVRRDEAARRRGDKALNFPDEANGETRATRRSDMPRVEVDRPAADPDCCEGFKGITYAARDMKFTARGALQPTPDLLVAACDPSPVHVFRHISRSTVKLII